MTAAVLFAGGTGVVGREAVRSFRARHPHMPILVGGRDIDKAEAVARETGAAHAVRIDIAKPRLGLTDAHAPCAIVMLAPDAGLHGLALAQELGIVYLSIGNWLAEVGAEMAHFVHRPAASPIVLASHWHGGPAVFLARRAVRDLERVCAIAVGALVDERDPTGPAAIADMEHGGAQQSGALAFVDGRRTWLTGSQARRTIVALDGRELEADAFAPYDIVSLHAATGAQRVRFDLAMAPSSRRLRGAGIATEILLEIEGERGGTPLTRRASIEFAPGQSALTGLSTALTLSTVLGLEQRPAAGPGLYFPELLMEADWFLDQLVQAGATVTIDAG